MQVTWVPDQRNLLGRITPAHWRYAIRFDDGDWTEDGNERDIRTL